MVYAAKIRATDNAINIGAYNNKSLVPIMAFENRAELKAKLDKIWDDANGFNLIRISRKEVVKWFGSNFCINQYNECCTEYDLNLYDNTQD